MAVVAAMQDLAKELAGKPQNISGTPHAVEQDKFLVEALGGIPVEGEMIVNEKQMHLINNALSIAQEDAAIREVCGDTFYIAGPMSGIPKFNFPAFDEAAANLRARGFTIVSPAELGNPDDREKAMASPDGVHETTGRKSWREYLIRDLQLIFEHQAGVITLPDWETSSGARLETFVALRLGFPVLGVFPELQPITDHPYKLREEWQTAIEDEGYYLATTESVNW